MTQANYIFLLLLDLALTVGISFLCSILESVLMSTPLSFISMREEEGYKPATLFKKYKTDIDRPIAAILAMNTIANTFGASLVGVLTTKAFGSAWVGWMSALTTLLILICSDHRHHQVPQPDGFHHPRHFLPSGGHVSARGSDPLHQQPLLFR